MGNGGGSNHQGTRGQNWEERGDKERRCLDTQKRLKANIRKKRNEKEPTTSSGPTSTFKGKAGKTRRGEIGPLTGRTHRR